MTSGVKKIDIQHRRYAQPPAEHARKVDIGFIKINDDITLRRMVVRHPTPQGTVLFLHGAWGEKDIYIKRAMGIAFAQRIHAELALRPGVGHYPHLQSPQQTIEELRASFRRARGS